MVFFPPLLFHPDSNRSPLQPLFTHPLQFRSSGRRIEATATCGESLSEPDTYCTLVGANKNIETPQMFEDPSCMLLQGQLCCKCDPNNETISHKPEFAIDGSERWWQSPPLSRGLKYNKVNLTIDLGQVRGNVTCG